MTDLTVLLATFNGARVLPRVLEGYANLSAGKDGWRLVIVDNASTDETPQIIAAYQDRLPIVAMHEPTPGKNGALNVGLGAIAGDKVIVTDDDAIPQPGFLDAWRRAFDAMPDMDVFGGSIALEFDVPPPDWMLAGELKFEELYAQRKRLTPGAVSPDEIFGPNMAVRRRVFDAGILFNSDIGPNSGDAKYGMGSESEFCNRAFRHGHKTAFASEPCVHHIVRAEQVDPTYWQQRAYRLGRGVASRHWLSGKIGSRERPVWVQAGVDTVRLAPRVGLALPTMLLGKVRWFEAQWEYKFFCGYQDEHRSRQRSARRDLHAEAPGA